MKNLFFYLKIFISIFLSASDEVFAVDCEGWLRHLSNDHHVSIVRSKFSNNSAFSYIDVPNSPYSVAIPKSETTYWKVDIKKVGSGSEVTAYNKAFGYTGQFDEKGNCINSSGFSYDNFDNKVPASLGQKRLDFNYDWKICEKVNEILASRKRVVTAQNFEKISREFELSFSEDYRLLKKLTKTIETSSVTSNYKISQPSVDRLIEICALQSRLIEQGNPKPSGHKIKDGVQSSPATK